MYEKDGIMMTAAQVVGPELAVAANRLGLTASGFAAGYKEFANDWIDETADDLVEDYDYVVVSILEFNEHVMLTTGHSANPKHGYVYIVTDGNLVKIGKTEDLEKRIGSIQTGNSREIILLQALEVDDIDMVEQSLHYWFRGYHRRGEWFDLLDLFGLDRMSCIQRALGDKCIEFGYRLTLDLTDGRMDSQPVRLWERKNKVMV